MRYVAQVLAAVAQAARSLSPVSLERSACQLARWAAGYSFAG